MVSQQAAVDRDQLAGDEGGFIARQEDDRSCHVLGAPESRCRTQIMLQCANSTVTSDGKR